MPMEKQSATPGRMNPWLENELMQLTLDQISNRTIFANARRICTRRYQRSPNWVLAMELFGLGSTYAHAMCRRLGIDPDGRDMKPFARAALSRATSPAE